MHRVLNIDEVLQNVFSRIDSLQTLYNLVLVCRAFAEPANDALWWDLDGLRPLFHCLPQDVFQAPVRRGELPPFARAPLPSEWARFQYYARRVRLLYVGDQESGDEFVDGGALEMLKKYCPRPILPNLTRLVWDDHQLVRYLSLITQDTLVALKCLVEDEEELHIVLRCIETSSPHLRELTIEADELEMPSELDESAAHAITSLNYLTSLTYNNSNLSQGVVLDLSRNPRLSCISLGLGEWNQSAPLSPSWGGFPALAELALCFARDIDDFACAATFVHHLNGACLTDLRVHLLPPAHAGEFGQLMSALRNLARLQKCQISFGHSVLWGDVVLSGVALAPLHVLADMRIFWLQHAPITFEPDATRALARAWTHLESLEFDSSAQHHSHLRLDDLAIFAEHCPMLRILALQVAPITGDWCCDLGVRTSTSSLMCLALGKSVIDPLAATQVAAYLAKIFPVAFVRRYTWGDGSGAVAVIERVNVLKRALVPQGMASIAES